MGCRYMKHMSSLFNLGLLVLVASCSRGSLFDGDDYKQEFTPTLMSRAPNEQSFNLSGSYGSAQNLFFGAGSDYNEITIFSRSASYLSDEDDVDQEKILDASMTEVTRHLIRHKKPLDLQHLILQPQGEFDPFTGAECVLTLKGSLQKEDQCEGAAKCKLYRVENIYSDKDGDTCNFPTVKSFVAKFDSSMLMAEVIQPGTESWIPINKINHFDTKSIALRISEDTDPFSSVVATTSSNGYVFAGKKYNKEAFSASFTDKTGTVPFRTEDLGGVSTTSYFEKAQTRNVLVTVTSAGFFKLGNKGEWEAVPLPAGLATMPTGVKKVAPVSGVGIAAFHLHSTLTPAASEKNILLLYRESTNAIEVIDLSNIALKDGIPADSIPAAWAMTVVNDQVWFWNSQAPEQSKKFDEAEKKWMPVALTLPLLQEAGTLPKHMISPAGSGFVLTLPYQQNITVNFAGGDGLETVKLAYKHFYYNDKGEAQGVPVSTFSAPDAMHVLNGKIYIERVIGIDYLGEYKIMDYGYIYDFLTGTGKIFKDAGFNSDNSERLAELAGILVNDDKSVLFYGGCEKPADIRQCLSANPLARLVQFNSL